MSELNDMTCAELAEVAAELALGVLTGRERAMAVAHLDQCDDCREDVRRMMATSGQLLELLPPAEPPVGFETRVLDRLGLPASAQGSAKLLRVPVPDSRPRRRPVRRRLAAAALGLAVVTAGLGGWRIGAVTTAPAASSAPPLTTASLLSAKHQEVGNVFFYSGGQQWLYMSVDLGAGNELVTCQVVGADGRATTIGSFRLAGGYGGWGTPNPSNAGTLRGARLVSGDGTVLATATFARG